MSAVAHDLIDQVLARVRDPHGVVASRPFVLSMLSKAQQIINARLAFVLDEATLTLEPLRCFYPIRLLLPKSQRVMYVRADGKDLLHAPWRSFWYMKRGWPRAVAEETELWCMIGRDILVVWPSRRVASTVTVVSAKLTDPLGGEQSTLELSDTATALVVDLTEVLVLVKMRKMVLAEEALRSLDTRLKAYG